MQIGNYHIVRKLGEGSMGKVYLAHVLDNSIPYAIKVLMPGKGYETRYHRFKREIRSLSMLEHPKIVRIFDSGQFNKVPYYVMEYVEGETLSTILKSRHHNPIKLEEVVHIILQVAEALNYLHKKSIIHRDLKPSNIMITKDRNVKLTDFGLVKILGTEESMMTETGAIIGTVRYMAPEQALGKTVDTRTDIYALGVLFYLMLTGELPFNAHDPLSLLWKIIQDDPRPPEQINPLIPNEIAEIIKQMIDKKPENRFPSSLSFIHSVRQTIKELREQGTPLPDLPQKTEKVSQEELFDAPSDSTEAIGFCFEPNYIERTAELTSMLDLYNNYEENQLFIVVSGEDGVGKSRLATEFGMAISRQNVNVAVSRSFTDDELPYQVFNDLIRNLRFIPQFSSEPKDITPSDDSTPNILKENDDFFIGDYIPLFLFSKKPLEAQRLDVKRKKYENWQYFFQIFKKYSKVKPLLIILEDLQNFSLDDWMCLRFQLLAFKEFSENPHNTPRVCILGTIKEEQFLEANDATNFLQRLDKEKLLHSFKLPLFSESQTGDLLSSLFACQNVSKKLFSSVHSVSLGNPLFIEEIAHELVRQKIVIRNDNNCILNLDVNDSSFDNKISNSIPSNYYEMILFHLENLDSESLKLLKTAAIIGEEFDFDIVRKLIKTSPDKLYDSFRLLLKKRILVEDDYREIVYRFRHPLFHEIVYTSMELDEIRYLQVKLAKILSAELKHRPVNPQLLYQIASHFQRGECFFDAARYYLKAGDMLSSMLIMDKALELYSNGCKAFKKYKQLGIENISPGLNNYEYNLFERRGAMQLYHGLPEAKNDFKYCLDLAIERGSSELAVRALNWLGRAAVMFGNNNKAKEYLEKANEMLISIDNAREKKRNQELWGIIHYFEKDYDLAVLAFRTVLKLQVFLPPSPIIYAHYLIIIAQVHYKMQEFYKARGYYHKTINVLEGKETSRPFLQAYRGLQKVHSAMGDNKKSQHYKKIAEKLAFNSKDLIEQALIMMSEQNSYKKKGNVIENQPGFDEQICKIAWILGDDDLSNFS